MKQKQPANFWRKIALQSSALVAALALLAIVGWKGWKAWRVGASEKLARTQLEKADYRAAVLAAESALSLDPDSEPATRVIAEATERMGIPATIGWHRRVSELAPGSAPDALAWARVALRFGEYASALSATAAVPDNARNSAVYHQLAGGIAIGLGRAADAGPHYAEAARLEPANDFHRYNHARWVIEFDKDPARRRDAEAALRALTASAEYGIHARRALASLAKGREQWEEALVQNTAVVTQKSAGIADWLLQLDLLSRLKKPEFTGALAQAQAAASDPQSLAALLGWMDDNGHAAAAAAWSRTLDPKRLAEPQPAAALAACLDSAAQWEPLRDLTRTGDWKAYEFLRNAYLSRAERQLGDLGASANHWNVAASAAQRTPESCDQLAIRASRWGWRGELRAFLWGLADGGARSKWALESLARSYQAEGDAAALLRIARRMAELDPAAVAARNNVAALSLLLGQDVPMAAEIAAGLVKAHPGEPGIVSTHALALHKAGKTAEAIAAMEKLKPAQLEIPAIAAYHGIFLAASGRSEAVRFLDLGSKARLLPQERALLDAARASLGGR